MFFRHFAISCAIVASDLSFLPSSDFCSLMLLIVPTFEENGMFMLGVVFFIQSIFADRNNSFRQSFFIPH